jgi:hypothetical protein
MFFSATKVLQNNHSWLRRTQVLDKTEEMNTQLNNKPMKHARTHLKASRCVYFDGMATWVACTLLKRL